MDHLELTLSQFTSEDVDIIRNKTNEIQREKNRTAATATRPKESKGEKKIEDKDRGFKMSADGRLIITAEDKDDAKKVSGKKAAGGRKVQTTESDAEEDLEDLLAAIGGELKNKSRKRKRDDAAPVDDEDEDKPSASKYKAGGSGIHRPLAHANRSTKEGTQVYGEEYKSKKAQGDMKKKGKPDPYAYVPLNFSSLNKRKQMKVKGSFKNLVKGAKRGAAKGMKSKSQKKKSKK